MPYKDPEQQKAAKLRYEEKNREKRRIDARNRKENIKDIVRSHKEKPCVDCGIQYPFYVMQFDHVRGTKEGGISELVSNRQLKKALEEIAKCDVVCANCHMARTYERQPKGEDHPLFIF